jgi:hypothetical protein
MSSLRILIAPALLALIAACASPADKGHKPYTYKLYPGPARPVGEIAVVRLGDGVVARLDGLGAARRDWDQVLLFPGDHTIEWRKSFEGQSFEGQSFGGQSFGHKAVAVQLKAGHVYSLHAQTTPRTVRPHPPRAGGAVPRPEDARFVYLWIDDDTTGQLVAGHK